MELKENGLHDNIYCLYEITNIENLDNIELQRIQRTQNRKYCTKLQYLCALLNDPA